MPYKTTKEVLERAERFHHRIREYYEQSADRVEKDWIKRLLEYMSRHETHLERALEKIEAETDPAVLSQPLEVPPDHLITKLPDPSRIRPDASVNEVVEVSLQLDEQLIELYRFMAEHVSEEKIRKFFTSLIEMEQSEELDLLRDSLSVEQE